MKSVNLRSRWFVLSLILAVCLCISIGFNVIQYLGTEHSPTTFVFTWAQEAWGQEREYHMTLTFDTVSTLTGANLSITARINTDRYYRWDNLDLLFDHDGDGEFKLGDSAFVLYVDNTIHWGFLHGNWSMSIPQEDPLPSPYHTCVFDESGYTFKINFPLEKLTPKNDLIYVSYGYFWTSFHFDPEGELFR